MELPPPRGGGGFAFAVLIVFCLETLISSYADPLIVNPPSRHFFCELLIVAANC